MEGCGGWYVPFFLIEECEKLITIIKAMPGMADYTFRRNEDNTGYVFIDVNDLDCPGVEQFIPDVTIVLENGEEFMVNPLAEGWQWGYVEPERYDEYNAGIDKGTLLSTVSKLL